MPKQFPSGETDRRGRIPRRGPVLLRQLLVAWVWVMRRYNQWARAVYLRLSRGNARTKQAMVARARKLLVRGGAMRREGPPWRTESAVEAAPA